MTAPALTFELEDTRVAETASLGDKRLELTMDLWRCALARCERAHAELGEFDRKSELYLAESAGWVRHLRAAIVHRGMKLDGEPNAESADYLRELRTAEADDLARVHLQLAARHPLERQLEFAIRDALQINATLDSMLQKDAARRRWDLVRDLVLRVSTTLHKTLERVNRALARGLYGKAAW